LTDISAYWSHLPDKEHWRHFPHPPVEGAPAAPDNNLNSTSNITTGGGNIQVSAIEHWRMFKGNDETMA
jgi:hypothetical protein